GHHLVGGGQNPELDSEFRRERTHYRLNGFVALAKQLGQLAGSPPWKEDPITKPFREFPQQTVSHEIVRGGRPFGGPRRIAESARTDHENARRSNGVSGDPIFPTSDG